MRKTAILVLIIISLLTASAAGLGTPRANAASLTVTPSSTAAGAVSTSMSVQFVPTYNVTSITLYLQGFSVSGALYASVSGGTGSATASASGNGSTVYVTFGSQLASGYTYSVSLTGAFQNPSQAGTYYVTGTFYGSGSESLQAPIVIGGGTGTGSLVVTPSSTTLGSYSTYMTVQFTPTTTTVSAMSLYVSGYTFSSITSASVSGGTAATVTATPSGNTVSMTFSSPLAIGYTYTVYLYGYIVNPTTAGTYPANAYLSGSSSQTLTGTVGSGSSGTMTVVPSLKASLRRTSMRTEA